MFTLALLLCVISICARETNAKREMASSLPNFIFILADDLEFNALNMAVNDNDSDDDDPLTPSADLEPATITLRDLANKGVYMNNYYSQESCAPARASLFTGRYPIHTGTQMQSFDVKKNVGVSLDETYLSEVLQDNGYTVYGLGKWHAGFYSPAHLPVSRGFDYYLGYMGAEETYWSKAISSFGSTYNDLMYMNSECYHGYDGSDMYDFSTYFYRDKAIEIISNHDFDDSPMYLYIAFQAVHTPYYDDLLDFDVDGIPTSYVGKSNYEILTDGVEGCYRKELALNLYLLDEAVDKIIDALSSTGQADNTYIIYASDNGGCGLRGGRNSPLVGQKETIFDGGLRVDSFIYSSGLIADEYVGTTYSNLMHVSDWFPTILSLAGISYTAPSGYELDGYDHSDAIFGDADAPRSLLLYNIYYNFTDGEDYDDFSSNIVFAIRNKKYKLVHAYDDAYHVYDYEDELDADDLLETSDGCGFSAAGTYTKYLFDMENDPYETTNLYGDDTYSEVSAYLYAKAVAYGSETVYCDENGDAEDYYDDSSEYYDDVKEAWYNGSYYLVPWIDTDSSEYASYCTFSGVPGISPTDSLTSVDKTMSGSISELGASYGESSVMAVAAVILLLLVAAVYVYKRHGSKHTNYHQIPAVDDDAVLLTSTPKRGK